MIHQQLNIKNFINNGTFSIEAKDIIEFADEVMGEGPIMYYYIFDSFTVYFLICHENPNHLLSEQAEGFLDYMCDRDLHSIRDLKSFKSSKYNDFLQEALMSKFDKNEIVLILNSGVALRYDDNELCYISRWYNPILTNAQNNFIKIDCI